MARRFRGGLWWTSKGKGKHPFPQHVSVYFGRRTKSNYSIWTARHNDTLYLLVGDPHTRTWALYRRRHGETPNEYHEFAHWDTAADSVLSPLEQIGQSHTQKNPGSGAYTWVKIRDGLVRPGGKTDRLGELWELSLDGLGSDERLRVRYKTGGWSTSLTTSVILPTGHVRESPIADFQSEEAAFRRAERWLAERVPAVQLLAWGARKNPATPPFRETWFSDDVFVQWSQEGAIVVGRVLQIPPDLPRLAGVPPQLLAVVTLTPGHGVDHFLVKQQAATPTGLQTTSNTSGKGTTLVGLLEHTLSHDLRNVPRRFPMLRPPLRNARPLSDFPPFGYVR